MDDLTRRDALKGGLGVALAAVLTPSCSSPPPRLRSPWVGGVSTKGATVAVKVLDASTARLKVARDEALSVDVTYSAPAAPDSAGMVKLVANGLQPATQYHYAVEVDGALHTAKSGSFRTSHAGSGSFTFAFGSCCGEISEQVFSEIRDHDPDLFIHLGDLHYGNISTNNVSAFESRYNAVLSSAHQGPFYANVPTVYTWSDHDYGAHNSDATSPARPAAQAAYRQFVPSYRLPSGTGGIYPSFPYGRLRFIITDNRSYRSPNSTADTAEKTVLGAEQKAWFKNTISAAREPVLVWANDTPWVGPVLVDDDEWGSYSTERRELADFVRASGKNLVIISGDMHALAADDGTNSPGGIPVFHAAAFSESSSHKGGPYTHGPYPPTENVAVHQYGVMRVRDSGKQIALEFTGYERGGTSPLAYTKTFRLQP